MTGKEFTSTYLIPSAKIIPLCCGIYNGEGILTSAGKTLISRYPDYLEGKQVFSLFTTVMGESGLLQNPDREISLTGMGPDGQMFLILNGPLEEPGFFYFMAMENQKEVLDRYLVDGTRALLVSDLFQDYFLEADHEGNLLTLNQHLSQILGVEDPRDIFGLPLNTYLRNPGNFGHLVTQLEQKGGSIAELEICLTGQEGKLFFGSATVNSITDDQGKIVRIFMFIKDISDRVNITNQYLKTTMDLFFTNEELKKTQSTLFQQEKMASIGQLAAGLAHEINNPLSFVINNVAVLFRHIDTLERFVKRVSELYNMDPEEYFILIDTLKKMHSKTDLDYIFKDSISIKEETEEGILRIRDILSSLKLFARSESVKVRDLYNLNQAIKATLTITRNEYKYKINIIKELGEIPEILCNPLQMNQVLLNLLMNAIEAIKKDSSQKQGTIIIRTWSQDDSVFLEIQDDGPGIPSELLHRVAEPFFTTKEVGKGTGLGLSTVNEIVVVKHGGALDITSEGQGTLVRITLPIILDL